MPMQLAALPQSIWPADHASSQITCQAPVRLAHDCSDWHGATRSIAFNGFRMHVAADDAGNRVLIAKLRPRPDHNNGAFTPDIPLSHAAFLAIQSIKIALAMQGIQLQHFEAVQRGQHIDAWLLHFSGNAYDFLKQFTVLESEYWLSPIGGLQQDRL